MLDKPEDGCVIFMPGGPETIYTIEDGFDLPTIWLKEAIHGLYDCQSFSVDGGGFIFTVSTRKQTCYMILEDEKYEPDHYKLIHVDLSSFDFCEQLYEDIMNNLEEWVHWDYSDFWEYNGHSDPERIKAAYNQRRKDLLGLLAELRELIISWQCYYKQPWPPFDERAIRYGEME